MKRVLLISVLLILALSISFGQIAFKKGDNTASAMVGFGSTIFASGATGTIPPISAAFDYGYNENISLGGILSITGSKEEGNVGAGLGYKFTYSYIIIAARGAYHYDLLHNDKVDTYGGLMIGYDIASSSSELTGTWPAYYPTPTAASVGGFSAGLFIGGRYFFSPQLAAQVELGYGIAYLNVGIAYKL